MRGQKIQSVRFSLPMMCAGLALAMTTALEPSWAQQRSDVIRQVAKKTETVSQSKQETEPARVRVQLKVVSDEYKSNLERLFALYEANAKRAEERLPKIRELLAQGLVTRREVDTAEDVAAQTRKKVDEARSQLKSADILIAEALVEAETEESPREFSRSSSQRSIRTLVKATAYIRYGGGRAWSLSESGSIKQFFMLKFGRPLPIHVFGQSPLHDRWGYDHRNAMDIGLSPDSLEGQALMEYLRVNGVPFTAFHFAIPGVATGPHIHVGLPSHRIAATVASKWER